MKRYTKNARVRYGTVRQATVRARCKIQTPYCRRNVLRKFEKTACDILQSCYQKDPENTNYLLTTDIPEFKNISLIEISFRFNCIDFMNIKCIKSLIHKQWYDKINTDVNKIKVKK